REEGGGGGGVVGATRGGGAYAEGVVHRPADLLVEQDVAREAVDLVVQPEGDFADPASAIVEVEQRPQVLLPARCLGGDDPPVLEHKPRVVDLSAGENGGGTPAGPAVGAAPRP